MPVTSRHPTGNELYGRPAGRANRCEASPCLPPRTRGIQPARNAGGRGLRMRGGDDLRQEWQQLLLAADHVSQFVESAVEPRIVDVFPGFRLVREEQEGALAHDVGDEQRREVEAVPFGKLFQGRAEIILPLPEEVEAGLLDLRDREPHSVLGELLAVLADHADRWLRP